MLDILDDTVKKYTSKLKRILKLLNENYPQYSTDTHIQDIEPKYITEIVSDDSTFPNGVPKSDKSPEQARNAILWYYRLILKYPEEDIPNSFF